jgi:hypothetical protein
MVSSKPGPQSVALTLMGVVRAGSGYIAGMLPLTVDYEAGTVTGLVGDEYDIEVGCAHEK